MTAFGCSLCTQRSATPLLWCSPLSFSTLQDGARVTLAQLGGNYPITKQFCFCLYQKVSLELETQVRALSTKVSDGVDGTPTGHSRSFPNLYLGITVVINIGLCNFNERALTEWSASVSRWLAQLEILFSPSSGMDLWSKCSCPSDSKPCLSLKICCMHAIGQPGSCSLPCFNLSPWHKWSQKGLSNDTSALFLELFCGVP